MPQWCGKTQDEADVATFHLLRAFHCAGRCTDCGACESACPQGIKVRVLHQPRSRRTSATSTGTGRAWTEKATPPLSVYRPNDPGRNSSSRKRLKTMADKILAKDKLGDFLGGLQKDRS